MKIFLTGDNHIGLKYASHEKADELIEARIKAFEGMVKKANEESCSLFVIAGDMFDKTTGISKKIIKILIEILSEFNGTVLVLPGNHDFYNEDVKLWKDFNDINKDYDNIKLLCEYKPYSFFSGDDEVVVYPAFCASKHSAPNDNNLGWIKETVIKEDGKYHIGIAHGAVEGETIDSEGAYFLMKRQELESIPVDVWLIGHTHVPFPSDLYENTYTTGDKIFNAGTHVQTDVSCNTKGECFIIDIDKDKNIKAKKYISGNIRFYRKNICVSAGKLKEKLSAGLECIDHNSVLDVILSGTVFSDEYKNRKEIITDALKDYMEYTYNDYGLSELITEEKIDSEFPETSFSAKLIKGLLTEPKEAQLVYELIKEIKEGK